MHGKVAMAASNEASMYTKQALKDHVRHSGKSGTRPYTSFTFILETALRRRQIIAIMVSAILKIGLQTCEKEHPPGRRFRGNTPVFFEPCRGQ
jgi:hypothetical protein